MSIHNDIIFSTKMKKIDKSKRSKQEQVYIPSPKKYLLNLKFEIVKEIYKIDNLS